jgi:molecular chaperone DnaJ
MQVSFTHDMIAITIAEDTKVYYYLQNIIEKNFSKKIGRKNKMIVFKQESENVQRRYLLKLLSRIYSRKHPRNFKKVVKEIQEAQDKSIKITLLKSNQICQQLSIEVNIEDNYAIVLDLGSKNSILVTYLKNYFKEHLLKYRPKNNTVTIYPNSEKTADLLENLLEQEELLGCYVNFIFDEKAFIEYKKILMKKINRRKKFNALYSLLEEYYEVLDCKAEDTFETIRKQYLKLVKQYHPDTISYTNRALVSQYSEKFQSIQHAYEMIKIHFEHEKSA